MEEGEVGCWWVGGWRFVFFVVGGVCRVVSSWLRSFVVFAVGRLVWVAASSSVVVFVVGAVCSFRG